MKTNQLVELKISLKLFHLMESPSGPDSWMNATFLGLYLDVTFSFSLAEDFSYLWFFECFKKIEIERLLQSYLSSDLILLPKLLI